MINKLYIALVLINSTSLNLHNNIKEQQSQVIDSFLRTISYVETNNGKYLNHVVLTKGMHAGYAAIGPWGLMPRTIIDNIKYLRNKKKSNAYLNSIFTKDLDTVSEIALNDLKLQKVVAKTLAYRLYEQHQGNLYKMAYGWNVGLYIDSDKITPDILKNNKYVRKFKEFQIQGK